MVPTLAGVILLIFFLFKFFGGDPAEVLAGQVASQEQIESIRRELGLDRPWTVQLWTFAQHIFTFDFGRSWMTSRTSSSRACPPRSPSPSRSSSSRSASPFRSP